MKHKKHNMKKLKNENIGEEDKKRKKQIKRNNKKRRKRKEGISELEIEVSELILEVVDIAEAEEPVLELEQMVN